jgi:protein transport protein YIF1
LPKHDTNAPDLYIPLMSFITYILLYGFIKGINLTSKGFSPDLLITAVWRCLLIQVLEIALIKFSLTMIGVSIPSLDVTAYTGYKYVGLSVNILSRSLGRFVSIMVLLYTSSMLGFFILKSLAAVVPQNTGVNNGPPRHLLIIGFAALEFCISLFLNWL